MNKTDFCISAADEVNGDLALTRKCRVLGRLKDDFRDDYMLVSIDPPVIGQEYGLGDQDITKLVISTRSQGETLFPISAWPCRVYISRILNEQAVENGLLKQNDIELIVWGNIFPCPGVDDDP